ncbi:protein FAR1-RELATED SEQUENCE 4-like [Bidens hawaiensis]|uniref:protein FAR1-RELATED SEQUENCE 4-like n=1 Tax=Bidens hawaiensis TaxID=980011 RepID=UPI00404A07F9
MIFDNLESAKSFYKRYALACGFSIRKATQWKSRGIIQGKYFVCSKEGQKAVKEVDTLNEEHQPKQKRRKPSQRTGCEARIRYKIVFVPFTGINNHNCNVTLGAALLGNETAETYTWLLKSFKDAFGYAPKVLVTDQDPAMKRAIEDVFPDTRHKLCMWHIIDKLSGNVGSKLCNKTDFKERLCDIVWTDHITPDHFEQHWAGIMHDFHLTEHEWLSDIYQLRSSWIPAFYRDEDMSGLMRTSSRSESENHFFGKFFNPRTTLVEFLAHFDSAIEHQRHEHRRNDHDSRYKAPETWSNFPLEK